MCVCVCRIWASVVRGGARVLFDRCSSCCCRCSCCWALKKRGGTTADTQNCRAYCAVLSQDLHKTTTRERETERDLGIFGVRRDRSLPKPRIIGLTTMKEGIAHNHFWKLPTIIVMVPLLRVKCQIPSGGHNGANNNGLQLLLFREELDWNMIIDAGRGRCCYANNPSRRTYATRPTVK